MSSSGGSVEVRITGALDPSLASSVKAAGTQVDQLGRSVSAVQQQLQVQRAAFAAVGGDVTKLTPAMLGIGAAGAEATAEVATGAVVATAATGGLRVATSGAIQEYVRLGHEAMTGNYSRIPGSLVVLASRMGGLQSITAGAALSFGAAAISIGAVVGILGYAAYEFEQNEKEARKLTEAFQATGRGAQLSGDGVRYQLGFLSQVPGSTRAAASGFLELASRNAAWSTQLVNQVGQLMPAFINLYGDQAPQAAGRLTSTLSDLTINGFQRLDRELLNLSPEEYQQIENLIRIGDTAEATSRILQTLSNNSGVYIKSLGDQVYDIEQKMAQIRAAALQRTGGQTTDDPLDKPRIDALQKRLDAVRQQEGAHSDNSYKNELDLAGQLNERLNERSHILETIQRLQKDEAVAGVRGDTSGQSKFTAAIAEEQKKLAELDKRSTDESYRNFASAEDAKAALYKSGSAQRIAIAQQEVTKAAQLYGQDSTEYNRALAKLNEEKRAASEQGLRQATKDARQEAEERLRAVQEDVANYRDGSQERIGATERELAVATELFGRYSSQGKAAYADFTRAVVAFNHEQGQSVEEAAQDRIKNEEEVFAESARGLDDLLSKNRVNGAEFISQASAVENARVDSTLGWLSAERTALLVIGEDTSRIDRAIEDEGRRHEKAMAQIARQGADAQIAELHRVNAQYLSAQDSFISTYLSGNTTLLGSLRQAGLQFITQEIQADARMWAERALLSLEGQQAISASEKGGMLFHFFAEASKTEATAAGQTAQVAVTQAGAAAKNTVVATAASKSILNDAYTSAAATYRSVLQAIPPPLNMILAPIAAAGTFAAVAAFDVISAEGGLERVQRNGQLIQAHIDESVMPASVAKPMRTFFERGGDTVNNQSGGDHFHYSPVIHATGAKQSDIEAALKNDRAGFYRFISNEHQSGRLRKAALGR